MIRKLLYTCIIGALISTLAIGAEVRKVTQEDVEWGDPSTTVTSSGGHVGHKLSNSVKSPGFYDVRDYSVSSSATASVNTVGIQTAIDNANSAGGGDVHIFTPGTYLISVTGNDPYMTSGGNKYCLEMKSNVRLYIHPGVVLQLADSQQVNGAPVNIITMGSVSNVYIGGGGRITGNTAGQTGWTTGGEGAEGTYGQSCVDTGCIISQQATGTSQNIIIDDLTLDDHWSNPVNLAGKTNGRPSGILLRNLWTDSVGEGFQVINADNVVWENLHVADTGSHMVGDATEISNVNYFSIKGVLVNGVKTNNAGSVLDCYQSSHGSISHVYAHDWVSGVSISPGNTVAQTNVTMSDVVMRQMGGQSCLQITGTYLTNVSVNNFICDNSTNYGAQIGNSTGVGPTNVTVSNSIFDNNTGSGILITTIKNLSLNNVQANNNTDDGITALARTTGIDNANITGLNMMNVVASNNGRYGVFLSDQGGSYAYTGQIATLTTSGNVTAPLLMSYPMKVPVYGMSPPELTTGNQVGGYTVFRPSGTVNTLTGGTYMQRLSVACDGAYTITDNVAADGGLHLAGKANFACVAGDRLELLWNYADRRWYEVGRSVN